MKSILCLIIVTLSVSGYSQSSNRNARDFSVSGSDKISRKDYAGAIGDLSKAIMLDSTYKQAYENRGVAKFYLQNYKGAIDDYTRALEIDSDDYTTFGRRGWAKFYLHDYTGAVSDLDKAVEGSKDKYRYCNFRGQAKFRLKDYDGAISDFDLVIDSRSGDKEQKTKALYWRGVAKIITGKKESGCLDLRKSVKSGNKVAKTALEQYCNN